MAKSRKQIVPKSYEQTIRALFDLSGREKTLNVDEVVALIEGAPDPETARKAIVACVNIESEVLARKWQQAINSTWSHCHPHVPLIPHLALSEDEVKDVTVIRDAIEFLREISNKSAAMVAEGKASTMHPDDALRLALSLPSWQGTPDMAIEHEASVYTVWRLRHVLQELGLIRQFRGQLCAVKSRVEIFLQFPRVQQFYMLWHTDVYHVKWSNFAPNWRRYVELMQGYLPLLWDMHIEVEEGVEEESGMWTEDVMDVFLPLWEQEGILRGKNRNVLALYRDMTVPAAVKKLIFEDLLLRYHLIHPEFDRLTALLQGEDLQQLYTWTSIGAKIMTAERVADLPCGIELLKGAK